MSDAASQPTSRYSARMWVRMGSLYTDDGISTIWHSKVERTEDGDGELLHVCSMVLERKGHKPVLIASANAHGADPFEVGEDLFWEAEAAAAEFMQTPEWAALKANKEPS